MSAINSFIKKNTQSLKGKTVALSGATGGLGKELCHRFCALGAELILLDRNKARSQALIELLKESYPDTKARHITLDLEDIDRVWAVCDELIEADIDYLVLNAGAYSIPRHKCSTGFDNVYQINFVSPYILLRRLLPTLIKNGGRAVIVGSIAHNYSKSDPDDVDFSTRKAASKVYGNAKRYLMFSATGIDGSNECVSVTHPGIAVTNITAHYPKLIYAVIKYPMKVIFMSPKKACLSILKGVFEPCAQNEWIGPRIFNVWGMPKKQKLATADKCEIQRIRQRAEEIYENIREERER